MVISHYLVSWVQVVGLIVGLYGFFFLSISVFGTKSIPWLRALLPATGAGLALLIAAPASWVFPLGMSVWLYIAAVNTSADRSNRLYSPTVQRVDRLIAYLVLICAVVGTLAYIGQLGIDMVQFLKGVLAEADFRRLGTYTLLLLFTWSMTSVYWRPRVLTEGRLQKVGVMMSVLAVLTQFIPPVLDLLNIHQG